MRFLASQPLLALLWGLGLSLQVAPARAAVEPTPTELSVARRLFEEGRVAEDGARWREAASKFRKAIAIKDTPGMRFHLARCEEEQGAFVEALVEYDRARELIDGGVRALDVEKLLAGARERVRAKVALLTVRLPSDVENVSVELDGKALSSAVLGVPMPINPGVHRVRAVAVGRQPFTQELALGTGEARQLPIALPAAMTVPPPAPARAKPSPPATDTQATRADVGGVSTRTIVLVGEASLFAVGVGAGIGFSVARSSASERYAKANEEVLEAVNGSDPDGTACSKPRPGCAEAYTAGRDRARAGALAVTSFVAAGVSAAAFGLTYWLWPKGSVPAGVQASVAPGQASVLFSGRF